MSTLDLKKIQQLVDQLDVLKEKIKVLQEREPAQEPEQPVKIDTEEDWKKYQLSVFQWQQLELKATTDLKEAKRDLDIHMTLMRQLIPSNIWIKTINCYVGYQTDSWPGYVPIIKSMPLDAELPRLYHRI